MTAKEWATRIHHCSNKETAERQIQAAMDEARNEALEEAACEAEQVHQHCANPALWEAGRAIARKIRALKTSAKPAGEQAAGKHEGGTK